MKMYEENEFYSKEVLQPLNTAMEEDDCPRLFPIRSEAEITQALRKNSEPFRTDPEKQPPKKHKKKEEHVNHYKGYLKLCFSGVSLIVLAYVVYIINPLIVIKNFAMSLKEGSYLSSVWREPPVKVYIKVFLFNFTNSERFLEGKDPKMKLEEVGPFVYCETLENVNITWNNNNSVTFSPKRDLFFIPEMSVGDPKNFSLVVPNVPLLGISSMLHKSALTLNIGLSSLVTYLNAPPVKVLSVHDYLWGYEDSLITFAHKAFPSWINFQKFGLLDRMMDEGDNIVTISTERTKHRRQYAIQRFNGQTRLKEWIKGPEDNTSVCDRVEGAVEGLLLPRDLKPGDGFMVFRKAFCRPLPLAFNKTGVTKRGFPAYRYVLNSSALDPSNPNNECYCDLSQGPCLPNGMSDMSPCYYNIPVAMSLPHFLNADPKLANAIDGLKPDPERHTSYLIMQPDAGIPLEMMSTIQLNIVVRETRMISRIKKFNNLIIPIVWVRVEMGELPGFINVLLNLLLVTGPIVQTALIVVLAVGGVLLGLAAHLRFTKYLGKKHNPSFISRKQSPIWPAHFVPVPTNPARAR